MESIAIVLLLIVFGGGALLVALIWAIVTGSARTDQLRRLQAEQESLQAALNDAAARVVRLESALGETMNRLSYVRAEQVAMEARTALLGRSEAPVAEREAAFAPPAAPIATPAPALEAPIATPVPAAESPVAPPAAVVAAGVPHVPDLEVPAPPATPASVPAIVTLDPPGEAAPAARPYATAARAQHVEPAPPVAAPPSSGPAPAPVRFDWERWVGVRGAAAVGACVLVIAGLYFFEYSIENDLVPPWLRVVLGVLVGLGGIGASELMLRRSYTVLANWVAGAGVAILYSAFWYAHAGGLVPSSLAFALMMLVTLTCGLLAVRHDAMVIALLGLVAGFTTPVALSTGEDHPFALFGYLLMLDGALVYLARRKSWSVLAALSLLFTAVYQVAWIGARMGPERLPLGIGILVVFGGVYAALSPVADREESELWKLTRAGTVLLPFGFGLYFSFRGDLGPDLRPLGGMLCVLSAGAAWMTRARAVSWASPVSAIAATTVLCAWLFVHDPGAHPVEGAVLAVALAVIFHAAVELDELRPHPASRGAAAGAAALSSLGLLACVAAAAAAPSSGDPRPWIAAWLALAGLAVRQSLFPGYAALRFGIAALIDVGFVAVHRVHGGDAAFPAEPLFLVAVLASTGLSLLSGGLLARSDDAGAPPKGRAPADEWAVLFAFLPAAYFASCAEVAPRVVPLALMLVALAAGAGWAARARRASGWIVDAAATLGLGTLALWSARHAPAATPWETALAVCAFAAVFGVFVEVDRRRGAEIAPPLERAAALAPLGGIVVLAAIAASPACVDPWPWLAGWIGLGALALRPLALPARASLHMSLALVLGLAFPAVQAAHAGDAAFPGGSAWMLAGLATAVSLLGASFLPRDARAQRWAIRGAATLALVLLVATAASPASPALPALLFGVTLALAAVAHVSAARLGAGGWSFAAVVVTAAVQTSWTWNALSQVSEIAHPTSLPGTALAGQALAVLLGAAWPLVAGRRLQASVWAWRAAALAGPLAFVGLDLAWQDAFGKGAISLLPLALGAVTLAVAWRARPLLAETGAVRRSALVWLLGVTLAAVSLAIPLQLQNEWVTVGWAFEGVALLLLWRRLDHAGLKYTALAHLAVVAVRLTVNGSVLEYHPRSGVPVFNWLAYTYWLPTLALLGAWYLLRELEVPRQRAWEAGLYRQGSPRWAVTAAAAAIVVFFVWINLTIFDAFGTGRAVEVDLTRLPARDLTLSLAWAIYALVLLGVGMARGAAGLRWTSLMLILVTIGKVFLYDLSHLHDLYRVVSLVGLALSLILISLLYQRFVFGKREEARGT